jgi:hypothetical protein
MCCLNFRKRYSTPKHYYQTAKNSICLHAHTKTLLFDTPNTATISLVTLFFIYSTNLRQYKSNTSLQVRNSIDVDQSLFLAQVFSNSTKGSVNPRYEASMCCGTRCTIRIGFPNLINFLRQFQLMPN